MNSLLTEPASEKVLISEKIITRTRSHNETDLIRHHRAHTLQYGMRRRDGERYVLAAHEVPSAKCIRCR